MTTMSLSRHLRVNTVEDGEHISRKLMPEVVLMSSFIGRGWVMQGRDLRTNLIESVPLANVRSFGEFNDAAERNLFEATFYAHYLRKRTERRMKGQGIAFDNEDTPRPLRELFERDGNGNYVAVVYQAAWNGWKLGRGA